jgi:hypothetical protein
MAKHVQLEAVGRTHDSPAISITAIVLLFLITILNQMRRRVGLLEKFIEKKVSCKKYKKIFGAAIDTLFN